MRPTAPPRLAGPDDSAGRGQPKAPDWHGLVAWDLWLNALTSGLFLVAGVGELTRPAAFGSLAWLAYPLALAALLLDLVCLVADLGDPSRFHYMLRVFKPTSPMSLGTWCLNLYGPPVTAVAALSLIGAFGGGALEGPRRVAVVLGLLPALGVAVYKGVLLSTTAQPGWRDARWMGAYHTTSAPLLGAAALLLVAAAAGQPAAVAALRQALVPLLVLNAVCLALLAANVAGALRRALTVGQRWRLGLVVVVGGLLAPLALVLLADDGGTLGLAAGFVLGGNVPLRFATLQLPHPV